MPLRLRDMMQGPTPRSISRQDGGLEKALALIIIELRRAAMVLGEVDDRAIGEMANLVYERYGDRTINMLRMAIRNGLNKGKVYGRLNYGVVAEWLNDQDAMVESHNYQQHLASKG